MSIQVHLTWPERIKAVCYKFLEWLGLVDGSWLVSLALRKMWEQRSGREIAAFLESFGEEFQWRITNHLSGETFIFPVGTDYSEIEGFLRKLRDERESQGQAF